MIPLACSALKFFVGFCLFSNRLEGHPDNAKQFRMPLQFLRQVEIRVRCIRD